MTRGVVLVSVLCLFPLSLLASSVTYTGYVTDYVTPARFSVDGKQIECTPATRVTTEPSRQLEPCPSLWLGEELTLRGKKEKKSGAILAESIDILPPGDHEVKGSAVIDRIIAPPDTAGNITISADGYTILVPGTLHPAFQTPLTRRSPVTTNLWLKYSGTQHADGSVTANSVDYSQNDLKNREKKAYRKEEFDPAAVTEKDRQSRLGKAFFGVNPKRFPAVHDPQMQQRVDRIGERLIPAYQRDLPADAPSKIDFRFQVIDQEKLNDAVTLSNGIILIPQPVVAKLQDDSELATVLADNIACALEKQELRLIPARRLETAGIFAADAAGVFVPGLGAVALSKYAIEDILKQQELAQSARVSLVLLHQAGFDIDKAPLAWWTLRDPAADHLDRTRLPNRARYLYYVLGSTWPPTTAVSSPAQPGMKPMRH